MMGKPQNFRSRIALMRVLLKELISDQPTKIKAFTVQPSPLLLLPRELRDQIYYFVLASTRVSFGKRGEIAIKPAPHALAILRVCRQTYAETQSMWLSQILFSFEESSTLLDKLCAVPASTVAQIRHLRTGGRALFLAPGTQSHRREYYSHVWALKFLPELSLDRLTVLGVPDGRENYHFLDELIKYGHGWRELYFFSQHSKMFAFAKLTMNPSSGVPLRREPQPSCWAEILRQRDGADSHCSVTIYRSEESSAPGSVRDPHRRQVFEQSVAPDDLGAFGEEEDDEIMAENEVGKEILVVVKRGLNADIRGLDKPPYKGADMRLWAGGKGWKKINKEWTMPVSKWVAKKVEVDSYAHVDDFRWSYADEASAP